MHRLAACGLATLLIALAGFTPTRAAEELDFRRIVLAQSRQTVVAVRDYIVARPDAPDRGQAINWLFDQIVQYGCEDEALPVVDQILAAEGSDPGLVIRARAIRCLALARRQEFDPAIEQYEAFIRGIRLQQAGAAVEIAHSLATICRSHRNFEASNRVYETLRTTFAIVPQVTEVANLRLARHELIGKEPPAIPGTDFTGQPFDWSTYKGKVVLVDFWATNCPPCLAAMPHLKNLYTRYKDKGFEIVGVSFDEHPELPRTFTERNGLAWRQFMDKAPQPPVSEGYRVATIPALFLVGRDGKIANADLINEELTNAIEQALAAP